MTKYEERLRHLEHCEYDTKVQWQRARDFQKMLSNLGVKASKQLQLHSGCGAEGVDSKDLGADSRLETKPLLKRYSRSNHKVKAFSKKRPNLGAFDYKDFENRLNQKLEKHKLRI